jgi:hypothetical protein
MRGSVYDNNVVITGHIRVESGVRRTVNRISAFFLPGKMKKLPQFSDGRPVETQTNIPPAFRVFAVSGVFIADIEACQKSGFAVDNRNLPVIAYIEPVQPPESRLVEWKTADTAAFKPPEVRGGRIYAADIVINERNPHSPGHRIHEGLGKSFSRAVVLYHVEFDADARFRREKSLEESGEKITPMREQYYPVPF